MASFVILANMEAADVAFESSFNCHCYCHSTAMLKHTVENLRRGRRHTRTARFLGWWAPLSPMEWWKIFSTLNNQYCQCALQLEISHLMLSMWARQNGETNTSVTSNRIVVRVKNGKRRNNGKMMENAVITSTLTNDDFGWLGELVTEAWWLIMVVAEESAHKPFNR